MYKRSLHGNATFYHSLFKENSELKSEISEIKVTKYLPILKYSLAYTLIKLGIFMCKCLFQDEIKYFFQIPITRVISIENQILSRQLLQISTT